MSYALNGISLGAVRGIRFSTVERADIMGMPFSGADSTLVYSFDGVVRKITIVGLYTGTTSEINTFISNIHALMDGQQSVGSGYALTSGADDFPQNLNITVHVEDFDFNWEISAPPVISYTLKLIQRA